MKAVRLHEYGGADVLRYEDTHVPVAGPNDVLIRVHAVALNHVDVDIRNGTSRLPLSLPHTLGMEFAGVIAACGDDVSGFAVGDRVTPIYQLACRACGPCLAGRQNFCERLEMFGIQRPGGYAEYAVAPASSVVHLPDAMSFEQATSTQTTIGTAWHCLITRGRLRPGETVLISAAGSGVGSVALQVARHAGARVLASAGSEEKLAHAQALGAEAGINYNDEDFTARVLELTGGRGVDLVLEHVGGDVFTRSLAAVAIGGRAVICGGHAGEVVPLDLIDLFRREISVIGCARASERELREMIALVGRGVFDPPIAARLPLEAAAEAHLMMEDRRQFGRIVLTV
jgi:NADPH:quinone reductase-like Zn-dependent oxidoreductase